METCDMSSVVDESTRCLLEGFKMRKIKIDGRFQDEEDQDVLLVHRNHELPTE